MGTETSKVRMTLKDEVSKVAGKIEKNLNMTGVLRGNVVSFNAALDIAGKFFRGLKAGARVVGEFIRLANEQERVEAQLAQTLKSTGNAAGFVASEIKKQAASLQQLTTFGDEAIIGAQNLLLTFTNIKDDVFPQATKIVLDMSQAMGQDLKTSALQVGKALDQPITGVQALTRAGVSFSKQQKDQIKILVESGDVIGAQKIILAELAEEFGGSAQAAAKTFAGRMKQIGNEIGDAKEKVGKFITESADLRATIETLFDIAKDLAEEFFNGAEGLDDLSGTGKNTFEVIFDGIKFVRIGFQELVTGVKLVKNGISLLQEVGKTAFDLMLVGVNALHIGILSANRSGLELASRVASRLKDQELSDRLAASAQLQTKIIAKLTREGNQLKIDAEESQGKLNTVVNEFTNIMKDNKKKLVEINDSTIKWKEANEQTTKELRALKAEAIALRTEEERLAEARAFRKKFPFVAAPEEKAPAPFSPLRPGAPEKSKEEIELQQRRDFSFKLIDMNKLTDEEIAANEDDAADKRLAGAKGFANALLNVQFSSGKKGFELQKKVNIGQALMSAYTGAAKMLELGPAGIPAAALIIAAGLSRVKQIASTKFGGGKAAAGGGGGRGGFAPARPRNDIFQRGAGFQAVAPGGRQQGMIININTGGAPILRENQLIDFISEGLKNRQGRDGMTLQPVIGAA